MPTSLMDVVFVSTFIVFIALIGNCWTSHGMSWYRSIHLPRWTPPNEVYGVIWTIIFFFTGYSVILLIGRSWDAESLSYILGLFVLNGFLNVYWSYLFFYKHQIMNAFYESLVLMLNVLALIFTTAFVSRASAILLLPYLFWVGFAAYLTYSVAQLNRK